MKPGGNHWLNNPSKEPGLPLVSRRRLLVTGAALGASLSLPNGARATVPAAPRRPDDWFIPESELPTLELDPDASAAKGRIMARGTALSSLEWGAVIVVPPNVDIPARWWGLRVGRRTDLKDGARIDRLEGIVRMALFMTMPEFSGIAATSTDQRLLQDRFVMVARIAALGVSLVCGGLIVAGAPFITAWMGPAYLPAYWLLLILSVAWMFDLSQIPALQILTALGQHRRFAYYDLAVAASSLSSAIVLGPIYALPGVAFGVALPVTCSALLLKPRFAAKALGLQPAYYYGQIGRMILGCLALQVPVWLLLQSMPTMSMGQLALFGAASYMPVGLIAGTVLLPKSDQQYVLALMPRRLAGGAKRLLPHLRQPA